MIDLRALLDNLALKRPLFHSEADFQHALAWRIQQTLPNVEIRLEYPFQLDKWIYLDIWVPTLQETIAVEVKYKTAALDATHQNEQFHLKNQAAQDIARYDFLKDLWRLEQVVLCKGASRGVAIILTNDRGYWQDGRPQTVDAAFRISEGRTLQGALAWGALAGTGTTSGRDNILTLQGNYALHWRNYAHLPYPKGHFRYLLIEVNPFSAG